MLDRARAVWSWSKQNLLRADIGLLIAATALTICGFVLWHVIDEVIEGDADHTDKLIVHWVAVHHGPNWFNEFMRDCTAFGGIYVLALITLAVGGFLWLRRERRAMTFLFVAVGGALALSLALKGIFNRPRPTIIPHESYTVTTSFPSGHSMLSAAVWLTLGVMLSRLEKSRWLKAYFISIAIGISVLTGLSRVYLGVHWPSDVLAGWMAGTVWAMVCFFALRHFQRLGKVEPEAAHGVEDAFRADDPDAGRDVDTSARSATVGRP